MSLQADYTEKKMTLFLRLGFIKIRFSPKKKKVKKSGKEKGGEKDEKGKEQKRPWNQTASRLLDAYRKTAGRIRRHVKFQKLELYVTYGNEDAAVTGIVCGLGYAVFYRLFGIISTAFSYSPPVVEITPAYNRSQLDIAFHGIIKVRVVHIMGIAFAFIKALI